MRWLKITDDNGQIDTSKLPKQHCDIVFRYFNKGGQKSFYATMNFVPDCRLDVLWLTEIEATHILILTDPNAPQPEDGLVGLLKSARCPNNCDNGVICHGMDENGPAIEPCRWCYERESALSTYEGGKA